jgi:hypothetical protein
MLYALVFAVGVVMGALGAVVGICMWGASMVEWS